MLDQKMFFANLQSGITFIGTDPRYERRGAASLMVQWGLERCRAENYPAYLESTMNAVPLYDRHGFVAVEKIYLELETANEDGKPESYTEIGLLYRP
jgi:ribosomal protein S18 acetylase RimI-like enzyme